MFRYGAILGLAAGLLTFGDADAQAPVASATANSPKGGPAPVAVDVAPRPDGSAGAATREVPFDGNPLWRIPLQSLSGQRDRPIFSPSRRPPPPPAPAIAAVTPVKPPPPKPPEPAAPPLLLLGTIVGDHDGIGIFLDPAKKVTVKLRVGQDHGGWTLHAVRGREARFDKGDRTAVLALPAAGAEPPGALAQAGIGIWVDGDGQMISPPSARTPPGRGAAQPAGQLAQVGSGTWMDGDGQMISPPPGRASPPTASPAAATPVEDDAAR